MRVKDVISWYVFSAAAVVLFAVTVSCHAGDDPYGRDSRNLTEDQLNQGYDNVFKQVDVMRTEQTGKEQQDQTGPFGVDRGGNIGSDGNQRTDDEMSNQKSYTE